MSSSVQYRSRLFLNEKNFLHSMFSLLVIIFYASIRSPLLRLCSNVYKFSALFLSLYSKFLNSGTNFVALC